MLFILLGLQKQQQQQPMLRLMLLQQQQLLLLLLLLLVNVSSCFEQQHYQQQQQYRQQQYHHLHYYTTTTQNRQKQKRNHQHQHNHQHNHQHYQYQHHHQYHRNQLFDDITHTTTLLSLSSSLSLSSLSLLSSSLSLSSSSKTISTTSAIFIRGGGDDDRDDRDDNKKQKPSTLSYHLIWTKGFLYKFTLTTILIFAFHNLIINNNNKSHNLLLLSLSLPSSLLSSSLSTSSSWLSSIGLSLLASSCCLLQLIVNVLAPTTIGCLGLNTTLGPIRPYFMSILFYTTFLSSLSIHNSIPQQLIFRLGITFLPEFVDIWNNNILHRRRRSMNNKNDDSNNTNNNNSMMIATVEYDVPTMGCVACINKIDSSLLGSSNKDGDDDDVVAQKIRILDVTSRLDSKNRPKGGTTQIKLEVKSFEEAQIVSQQMIEKLKQIGFGKDTTITKLELSSSESSSESTSSS